MQGRKPLILHYGPAPYPPTLFIPFLERLFEAVSVSFVSVYQPFMKGIALWTQQHARFSNPARI